MQRPHEIKYRAIPAGYEDELDDDFESSITATARNLKITLVPDITSKACLNGEDFDTELPGDIDNWFEEFRDMWNMYKKTPATTHRLQLLFMRDREPLLLALKLFAASPGCNNLKNKNLALFILETVCDLYKQHPGIAHNCDDNTRMIAFNFVKTCGIVPLYKAVMDTYELMKIRDLLVPKIQELISQGHYKDVAYWAMNLQLTHLFGLYDLVFPLILQDKVFLAEEYLNFNKALQLPTVQFLDSLLDKQKGVYELCADILEKQKYVDIKHNVLSYRPMSKLVTRLVKKYKIEAQRTPNLNYTKACSYIHYLYRKYMDGGMSCESFRELVQDAAITKALQLDLVNNVASYGSHEEAIYWAMHYGLELNECPSSIQAKLKQSTSHGNLDNSECDVKQKTQDTVDAPQVGPTNNANNKFQKQTTTSASAQNKQQQQNQFLSLDLPFNCIILIDKKTEFLNMLDDLYAYTLISFDSEWKPSVCNDNVVSLLQLSTDSRVYLIDCLSPQLTDDLWRLLGRKIFNNLEILKIGFSLHQDLQMLHKSLPLQLNLQATAGYLDLRELWRRLKYMQVTKDLPFGRVNSVAHSGESLCALSELCLGKKLDKSNQCSNWANRPLRHDQMIYAALDAYCLIQIYSVFAELLLRMGMDIDQVVEEVTTSKTGYMVSMKRAVAQQYSGIVFDSQRQDASAQEFIGVTDVKFLCDNMLLGLSKELRKLGIDCLDIGSNSDINDFIEMAKRERRYVLTRDARYVMFNRELPESQCLQIPTDSSVDQVLNIIEYFGIAVEERNLFTRCLLCNGNEFILALKTEMQLMRFGQLQLSTEAEDTGKLIKICPHQRTFKILNLNEHIKTKKTTYNGKPIKLNRIKPHILDSKQYFYICDNCGVCTWDGAHPIHSSIMNTIAKRWNTYSYKAGNSINAANTSASSHNLNSKATP